MGQNEHTISFVFNGTNKKINPGATVGSLLLQERVARKSIDKYPKSVLLNGVFIPPEQYEQTEVRAGDDIRVIIFMGGG